MAKGIKRPVLLMLVLVFLLSSIALPASAADAYTALDLSETQSNYALDATGQVVVKGVKADGTTEAVSSGVSFASGNEQVATVSSTGAITPVAEGLTTVTATVGDAKGSVVIIVYKEKNKTKNFDDGEANYTMTFPQNSAFNGQVTYDPPTTELSDAITRTGIGKSLHLKQVPINSHQQADTITIPENQGMARIDPLDFKDVNGKDFRGVAEIWFYDNMAADTKRARFWLMGNADEGMDTQSIRGDVNMSGMNYAYNVDGGNGGKQGTWTLNTIPRSKGWHQLIIDYSQDNVYNLYIDGSLLATRVREGWNQGLASITIDRFLTNNNTDHEFWLDDFAVYDVRSSTPAKPVAQNITISGKPTEEQKLTASYQYRDANGDKEDKSKTVLTWERSDNGTDSWSAIADATGAEYTLTADDVDKYIRVSVKPVSVGDELAEGDVAYSDAFGPIAEKPVISELNISSLDVGQTRSHYAKGDQGEQIIVYGTDPDKGTFEMTGVPELTYVSSDPYVLTVNADGTVNVKNSGYSIVTVTAGEAKASVMIVVNPGSNKAFENFEKYTPAANQSVVTDPVHTGNQALKITGGNKDIYGGDDNIVSYIAQAWFYDDGTANGQAQIYFQGKNNKTGLEGQMPVTLRMNVGILSNGKDYYEFDNQAADRKKVGPGGVPVDDESGYVGDNTFGIVQTDGQSGRPLIERTEGWHQVALVINGGIDTNNFCTDKGTIAVYLDGVELFTENYVPFGGPHVVRGVGKSNGPVYDDFSVVQYDIGKRPPMAYDVAISGASMVDQTMTVTAEVKDFLGDELAPTTYQWQVADTPNGEWTNIPGATNDTFTITAAQEGKYVRAGVTPHSTVDAKKDGETIYSAASKQVSAKKNPPSVSAVTITGTPAIGEELTANYTYTASDGGNPEGNTTFTWERSDNGTDSWEVISNAKTSVYAPGPADASKYLRVTVTPVDSADLAGAASAPSAAVKVSGEIAYYVSLDGDDSNSGSFSKPFATIGKARDVIRAAKAGGELPVGQITVYIMPGVYQINSTTGFTEADSGTAESPIVYQAYDKDGGEVIFEGGKVIDSSLVKPASSEAKSKVIDDFARDKLMQLDLTEAGIDSVEEIPGFYGFGKEGYRPTTFYYNGVALGQSRWPNDNPGAAYLWTDKVDDYSGNIQTTPFSFTYKSGTNADGTPQHDLDRTKLWDLDGKKDLYIGGYIGSFYSDTVQGIANLDVENKKLTSTTGSCYKPLADHRFYFFNLIEEIDLPGESYLDRDSNILYFYPFDDNTADASIEVSTLDSFMFEFNKTQYVTLKGITMSTMRNKAIKATNVENMVFDDLEISHGSSNAIELNGNNNQVINSHIYDMGSGGITVTGGDRKTLEGGRNLIENNRIHSVNRVYYGYQPAVWAYGVGQQILHNDLYDGPHMLVRFQNGSNDHRLEYNEIYNAVDNSSDMGAVYWGRNPTELGIEINYNYFHDMGNPYGGHGQQSVFWDDGAYGPHMKGNIFYRGTLTADQSNDIGRSYAVKTNGGQYSVLENNIFIDAPAVAYFQPWAADGLPVQNRWWLWALDASYQSYSNVTSLFDAVDYESEIWHEHYEGTQWDKLWTHFNDETRALVAPYAHGSDLKAYTDADKTALNNIAKEHAPGTTNVYKNNVSIDIFRTQSQNQANPYLGSAITSNNWDISKKDGQGLFEDYNNQDFTLTAEGLAKIQQKIPEFEAIPFDEIGLRTDIGGLAPTASNVRIAGNAEVGGTLTAEYDFSDPDGDKEGVSEIIWYLSDTEDGTYTRIPDRMGLSIPVEDSYNNKYVKFEIKATDDRMLYSKAISSNAIKIGGELSAADAIAEAEALYNKIQAGTNIGQAPSDVREALKAEIDKAKALSPDADVTDVAFAIESLQKAGDALRKAVVSEGTITESNQTIPVVSGMQPVKVTINSGVTGTKMLLPQEEALPEINISGYINVDGTDRLTTVTIAEGTVLSGKKGTDSTISLFSVSTTPSKDISNAEKITAVMFANGSPLTFSNPVRMQIEGVYDKKAGLIDNKFTATSTSIKTDNITTAQNALKSSIKMVRVSGTSPNLVLWARVLNELALYDSVANVTPTPGPNPPNGGGSGTNTPSNPNGNGTTIGGGSGLLGGGSKFVDITNHWAKNDIEEMYKKGIVSGVTETTFEPDRPVTRAEFAALIVRALNLNAATEGQQWKDVAANDWFASSVYAAANVGLIAGYDGWFRPDDLITREEMAVVIAKAYAFKGGNPSSGAIDMFADRNEISDWAYSYVDTTAAIGILKGITPTTFGPSANATRAEATSLIKRLLDLF